MPHVTGLKNERWQQLSGVNGRSPSLSSPSPGRFVKISLLVPMRFSFDPLIDSSKVQRIQKSNNIKKLLFLFCYPCVGG